jgi:hypothetical protein
VRAHPGPRVWGSKPLRGNQEAPSQTGGHAECSARGAAFVRASWVGPPNRASPMRWQAARVDDFLGKDPAGSGGVGPSWSYGMGSRPLRGNQEAPSQTGVHAECSARGAAFVRASWVGPPNRASPMRGSGIVLGTCRAARALWVVAAKQGFARAWVRPGFLGTPEGVRTSRVDPQTGLRPMCAFVVALGTFVSGARLCESSRPNRASSIRRFGWRRRWFRELQDART